MTTSRTNTYDVEPVNQFAVIQKNKKGREVNRWFFKTEVAANLFADEMREAEQLRQDKKGWPWL